MLDGAGQCAKCCFQEYWINLLVIFHLVAHLGDTPLSLFVSWANFLGQTASWKELLDDATFKSKQSLNGGQTDHFDWPLLCTQYSMIHITMSEINGWAKRSLKSLRFEAISFVFFAHALSIELFITSIETENHKHTVVVKDESLKKMFTKVRKNQDAVWNVNENEI